MGLFSKEITKTVKKVRLYHVEMVCDMFDVLDVNLFESVKLWRIIFNCYQLPILTTINILCINELFSKTLLKHAISGT